MTKGDRVPQTKIDAIAPANQAKKAASFQGRDRTPSHLLIAIPHFHPMERSGSTRVTKKT